MPKPLTDAAIRKVSPPPGPGWMDIIDGAVRGLTLRVSPRGEKIWSLTVTHQGGKRRRHTIGRYPVVSLADARERARETSAAARDGISPELLERRREAAEMTVSAAHGAYLKAVGPKLRNSTLVMKRALFLQHIEPVLGNRLVRTMSKSDLVELADKGRAQGLTVQINRIVDEVMACLRWCADRDWIESIPTKPKSIQIQENPRDRTLSDQEIAKLWSATERMTPTVRDYLRLLLLTGQRTEEVRAMSWPEVDLQSRMWTIPAERYKTRRPQVVPLSEPVVDILKVRKEMGTGAWVLAGRDPDRPWNGERNAGRQLRREMPESATFVFHDLRRTVRTGLSRLRVAREVAEAVIGHADTGIVRVYDRHDRTEEKRQALERWAKHVIEVTKDKSELVPN